MKYGIRTRDIMSRKPVTVKSKISLSSAAKLMKSKKVGSLIVVEDGKVVGMLTDGDIVKRAVAAGKNPSKTKVSDVMSRKVFSVSIDDDLYYVTRLLNKNNIKRAPVYDNDRLVGYLSQRDLLKIEPGLLDVFIEKLKIKQSSLKLGKGSLKWLKK